MILLSLATAVSNTPRAIHSTAAAPSSLWLHGMSRGSSLRNHTRFDLARTHRATAARRNCQIWQRCIFACRRRRDTSSAAGTPFWGLPCSCRSPSGTSRPLPAKNPRFERMSRRTSMITPALRSTAATRAAAFDQPENARIRLPRARTSTDFEAEKCAEML